MSYRVKITAQGKSLFVRSLTVDEVFYTADESAAEQFAIRRVDFMTYYGKIMVGMPFSDALVYDEESPDYFRDSLNEDDLQSIEFVSE